jgi:acetyl esterase/lipase
VQVGEYTLESVAWMNQTYVTWRTRGWLAALCVAPLLALGGCGSDPVGVGDGGRFLDEIFETTTEEDLQYGAATDESGAEEALLLDLYQPVDDTMARRPAVVWIHGGSFQSGHKGQMAYYARGAARRGFVSVTMNYRLRENQAFDYTDPDDAVGAEAKRDAQHDAQAAVRWLRANADDLGVDPDRIFLAGFSAGGTTALWVAGASVDDTGSSGNPGSSSSVAAVVAISASLDAGILETATGRSLLIHGANDTKVPLADVEAVCATVDRCDLVTIPGADHNMINSNREDILPETMRFLHALVRP